MAEKANLHLSIAQIELYMKCPRAYELRHVRGKIGRQTLSGAKYLIAREVITDIFNERWTKTNHDEIESDIEARLTIATENSKDVWEECLKFETQSRTKREGAHAKLVEWCLGFITHRPVWNEVNRPIKVTLGDIEVTGRIDIWNGGPNDSYTLSTSSQRPDRAYLERSFSIMLAQYWKWLTLGRPEDLTHYVYWLPALETYKRQSGLNEKGDLKGAPEIAIVHGEKALLEFEYEISYVASRIQNKVFPMAVNPTSCKLCSYQRFCTTCKGTVSVEIEENWEE